MPIALGTATAIAGGLGLASTLATNYFNKKQQDKANNVTQQNNAFSQEQYLDERNYNRELQERLFQREDNAYTRTKDDLLNAGYSPLAINGTNEAGNVVSQAQMPELSSINPFQAQNMDFGQLADILAQADSRQLERDKFEYQKKKDLSDKEFAESQAAEQTRQFNATLDQTVAQMKQQGSQFIISHGLEATKQAKQSKFIDAQIEQISQLSKLENNKAKNQAVIEAYGKLGGQCEFFTDKNKYEVANTTFMIAENAMLKECEEILAGNTSESKQKSKNVSGGLNFGLPKKVEKLVGNAQFGANGQYGDSESESYAKDLVAQVNAKKETFYKSHKKPILWEN